MPKSHVEPRDTAEASSAMGPVTGTRVDGPHPMARERADATTTGAANALPVALPPVGFGEENPVEIIQQVRTQAEQLAAYLRADQKALDHREAELNARQADLEHQARGARLWLAEQRRSLNERLDEIANRERELEVHSSQVARRAEELQSLELELEGRSSQLAAAQFAHEQLEPARRSSGSRDKQSTRLEQVYNALAEAQNELEAQRQQLDAERQRLHELVAHARREISARQQAADAELAERREAIDQAVDRLDRRQAEMDRFRSEVRDRYRETLELRLATEELWNQLTGTTSPAVLTRSLAEVRERLSADFRLEKEEASAIGREMAELVGQIAEEHSKLAQHKREAHEWFVVRQQQIEQSGAQLAEARQDLVRRRAEADQQAQAWHAERQQLKQEILRLLAEIAQRGSAAA